MNKSANKTERKDRCTRCSAINNEEHPLHGFQVELEEIHKGGKTMKLCQRCKVRVMMKERKRDHTEEDQNLLSRLFDSLSKSK